MNKPEVIAFFDEPTFTVSYVVADPVSNACAVVDSVLAFDPDSGRTDPASVAAVVDFIEAGELKLEWILETHVHADHLSAAPLLRERFGGRIAIGSNISVVQETFGRVFNAESGFRCDGSQFDQLFEDGDEFTIGTVACRAMHTPGHTPACMTYVAGDAAFVGDTLFMPDYGTARCDFPGGDAATLYDSIQKIFALPPATRVFLCHDYLPAGRDSYAWETTVAEQRANNIHVHDGVSRQEFVTRRTARDKQLSLPHLILPSVQVNMRAGQMPPAESNG
ncbi:MAG: MBL fold metallo-hydrolase, partial [Gammaproteobacteria bacterium]|nr:MBL fold metallo-hydrolase [Gammaproteobacteria bacterium]